ncbi:DUF6555 family protein [Pseudomonas viridiflava]|uniref:DUF6555 family protein n=1 Tax=Pseudomonas viridiflava TaxID=33069 RepID=UPI0030FE1612
MDSGVAQIPKYRRDRVQIVSKPLAKRHGIVRCSGRTLSSQLSLAWCINAPLEQAGGL